jgi:hypothetical protein
MVTEAARSSFAGVDADLWVALGTVVGPLLAVFLGLLVFRYQQQSQSALQRFLTDGVQSLFGTFSTLLSIHLQNYQIGTFVIRTLRTYEWGHPLAPEPDEIPRFLGLELESLPIDSVLPVQELVGDKVVLEWVMSALSDVTLEAKMADSEIRQPIAAYYRTNPKLDRDEAVQRLTAVLEAWNTRVSAHFALLDRLNDLARHLATKLPWTVGGYYAVYKRKDIDKLRAEMHADFEKAQKAHDQTEKLLRSGGADRGQAAPA